MKVVKVTYTVRPGFVRKNQENIEAFLKDLKNANSAGIRYAVHLGDDGKTFHHVAAYTNDDAQKLLLELPAFLSFQKQRDDSGLEVAPSIDFVKWSAFSHDPFKN